MNIEHTSHGNAEVVRLPPRIMMADAPRVRSDINALIDAGRSQLVLDLEDVELMDSSGLSVLISAWQRARKSGGTVVLAAPGTAVRTLLELARVHEVLNVYEDRTTAVERLS